MSPGRSNPPLRMRLKLRFAPGVAVEVSVRWGGSFCETIGDKGWGRIVVKKG